MANIVKTYIYIHGDDDSFYEKGIELGMDEDQASNFSRTAYELRLDLEVDLDTGEAGFGL